MSSRGRKPTLLVDGISPAAATASLAAVIASFLSMSDRCRSSIMSRVSLSLQGRKRWHVTRVSQVQHRFESWTHPSTTFE